MRLKQYLSEGIHDKGILKAVFLAGNPGSGKSYTISKIKSGAIEPKIVNTDTFVEYYMEIDPNFEWSKYSDKSKQLAKAQLSNYLNSMLPLFIDGTSSNSSAILRRKGILQSIGYDVSMVFVTTSLETSIERAAKRKRKVDPKFIEKAYDKSIKLKPYYKSEFNKFLEINNNDGELTDKIILSSFKKMNSFFTSDILNPIGVDLKELMLSNNYKYLIDTPQYDKGYLNKLVTSWYKK